MNRSIFIHHRLLNLVQTACIMAALFGILLATAWLFAGLPGVVLLCAVGIPLLALGGSKAAGLVLKMYRATRITPDMAPELVSLVHELAARAGLPAPPPTYYIPSNAPVAFSVGMGKTGAIALSDGMMRLLSWRELVGVVAHEISHIASNDMRVMGVADLASRLASAISTAGQFLFLLNIPLYLLGGHPLPWLPILLMASVPLVMTLLQLALSRSREFEADLAAVNLTGDAAGLASALQHIEQHERRLLRRLFVPYRGLEIPSVLRTHPATPERIRRLLELTTPEQLAPWQQQIALDQDGRPVLVEVEPPRSSPRRRISGVRY